MSWWTGGLWDAAAVAPPGGDNSEDDEVVVVGSVSNEGLKRDSRRRGFLFWLACRGLLLLLLLFEVVVWNPAVTASVRWDGGDDNVDSQRENVLVL
jgi:hypothetical protein